MVVLLLLCILVVLVYIAVILLSIRQLAYNVALNTAKK